jgi:VWFA-related protein
MLPALLLALALHAQEPPAIRVPVPLATIPTLVFSQDNRLVPDLHASNFRLLDNGRPQSIAVDESDAPISVAVIVQANRDVRAYLPFIAKAGSVIDALVAGASFESALIRYEDDVATLKPFDTGDLSAALKTLSFRGRSARMLDAADRAIRLLAARPPSHTRILLVIGQPIDAGSESSVDALLPLADAARVSVFTLSLPLIGKAFVSDTFWLHGVTQAERGGFRTGTDFKNLIQILNRSAAAAANSDPFTALTAATGGTQLRVRTQRQLEDALGLIGFQLRSAYTLTYRPSSDAPGYHTVTVEVDLPGAKVHARPGYWRPDN